MNIDKAVSQMEPPRYTTAQAAEIVGRSTDTLKRWRAQGAVLPSDYETFGSLIVPLYTQDDINALKATVQTMRPGRKRKEEG